MLANDEVLAPVYYILGGTKSGEVTLHLILFWMQAALILVLTLSDVVKPFAELAVAY